MAIFHGVELRDWFIKTLPGKNIKEKINNLDLIFHKLIQREMINIIAVKKQHSSRCSLNILKLNAAIRAFTKRKHLAIIDFPIEMIKKSLLVGKQNKKHLIEEVQRLYPVVYYEYKREKNNKSRYLTRMFEAIALGIVCNKKFGDKRKH